MGRPRKRKRVYSMPMKSKTHQMILTAIFTALTAVGAFIRIPLPPVPFTLQMIFVVLSGIFLGSRMALVSQLIYIALGLIGMPIFASGGGIQYIFNPSFGYLIGFAAAAFLIGAIVEKMERPSFGGYLKASITGLIVSYICGVLYFYIVSKYIYEIPTSLFKTFISGCVVFLPWDIAKMVAASWLAKEVSSRVKLGFKRSS